VDAFAADWRTVELDTPTKELLRYADRLTRQPGAMGPEDVERLRAAGWTDRAVHDATQVCGYFNYINRIADGLGVEMEDWLDATGRPLP
jgi:alkylhydroperoxidase family enzyme